MLFCPENSYNLKKLIKVSIICQFHYGVNLFSNEVKKNVLRCWFWHWQSAKVRWKISVYGISPKIQYGASLVELRFLWRLMKVVWQKHMIPTAWRRAGGILIPKEKDAEDISQFRHISLLNVEGKIFFSVLQAGCLPREKQVHRHNSAESRDSRTSGCLEHTNMIWHQIQAAKKEQGDLHVVFLDHRQRL